MILRRGATEAAAVVGTLLLFGCGSSGAASNEMANPGGSGAGGTAAGGANNDGGTTASNGGSGGMTAGGSSGGAVSQGGTAGAGAGGDGGAVAVNFEPEFSGGYCIPKGPQVDAIPGLEVIYDSGFPTSFAHSLAVRDGWFYWSNNLPRNGVDVGIYRRAPGSTEDELMVSNAFAWAIFVTDTHVYWIGNNQRTLMRASLAQLPATPEEIVADVSESGLLVDDENIFFNRTSGIFKLPLADAVPGGGATPVPILPQRSGTMTLNGDELLYVDYQTIYGVPITGGTPRAVMTLGGVSEILATVDTLFAVTGERIVTWPIEGTMEMIAPLAMANLLGATDARLDLEQMRLEGDRLYYRETTGDIAWVKTDGSDCHSIARMTNHDELQDNRWVMDDTNVYVVDADERLLRIPR